MATDYKKIKPIINLRSIRQSSDKTHFIYELIQNAYDSKSRHLELHLHENELLVWNDGDQFSQEDVHRICSIGFSAKDLTQVGHYGIGFKAVYNYTDRPEVYSGDEHFCIPDPTSTRKTLEDLASSSLIEGIDEVPPRIAEHINKGRTVFRLPFRDSLSQEDITLLKNQLRDLDKRVLLFLQDFKHELKSIQWRDERDGEIGSYSCWHSPYDKVRNASEVELTILLNGKNQLSETFLVFRKEVQPRQDVVNKLLQQAEDGEEQQRIQKSAEKKQPVEVAFKLHEDRIIETDNSVLFAYLPTEKETHLRFLIQARYQTTPPRDNIVKSSDSPWNEWLVQETADFLPEILEQLKVGGLLEPAFFNVLPLKDEVENEFKPIAEAAKKAMREKLLVPTEDDGYAKAENVFYPHHGSLRKLVESSWLYPNSSWLHTDIGGSGRAFDIMKEAGVKEINVSHVLNWLEKRDLNWFENRCEKWLSSLYIYLNSQKSRLERINGLERIKKLPLIRFENKQHVCASDQLVFFPPDTDEGRKEIEPFLSDLPILQSVLLEGEERNEIEAFFKHLGVKTLQSVVLILEWICPQYRKFPKPSAEKNRLHVRYLFEVWSDLSQFERNRLKGQISEIPILQAYKGIQCKTYDFVKPGDAYLPKAYTDDDNLETYFSVHDGEVWFVDATYMEDDSNRKDWLRFLKAIGGMDTPRVIKKSVPVNDKECSKRSIQRKNITRTGEETIEDHHLHGLPDALNQIKEHKKVDISRSLWCLLVKVLPPTERGCDTFFQEFYQGTYCSRYRSDSYLKTDRFNAIFYYQLKETAWLPDEHGNLHKPSECFAPTNDNRKVLGDSVAYLHPDFDVSEANETARWLAEKKLRIHLNANTDSVLNYLQTLSGTETGVEKVLPLYRFLENQGARREAEFKRKPLIFTANPEPRWWKADEVFWKDERPVFGNHRGYLERNYAAYEGTLKPFFIASGVLPGAAPSDYARVIRKVTSSEKAGNTEVRDRVETLYRHIMPYLHEVGNSLENEVWQREWKRTREGRCWLGKEGDEWDFFFLHELVWKDDDYHSRFFKDKIPFWAFDNDLLEFAKYLGVNGCYEVSDVECNPYSDQGEDQIWSEKVQNLYPYIYDFLNSPRLCEQYREEQAAEILKRLSVHRAQRLEVRYRLNEASVPDPNPRQSFLEKKKGILWLGLEEDEESYPDLIGDALQDDFRIDQLREFVKDLLPSVNLSKTALLSWKRRGFQPNRCLFPPKSDSKEDEENSSNSVDEKFPCETGAKSDSETNNSESETPTVHENPETGNGDSDSTGNGSETATYQPHTGRDGTRPSEGKAINTPNRNRGTDHSSGRNSGRKDDTRMDETDTSPQVRKEVEDAGMKHAHCYEKKEGRTPEDVSSENRGYDIYSTSPDGKNRCIEVKARDNHASVVLTSNEWSVAKQLKDTYFLYVVLNARTQPELYIIQNPADKVAVDERYDVRYQVPLSEITEHGILV